MRSDPRSVKAGMALMTMSVEQDDEHAEADHQREQEEDLEDDPADIGLPAAKALLDGPPGREGVAGDGHQYAPPDAPHERFRREVEDEGDDEQQKPDEEEALEGELGAPHLVGADGQRRHRRRHRLALLEAG